MKRIFPYLLLISGALLCAACNAGEMGDEDKVTDESLWVRGVVVDGDAYRMMPGIELVLSAYASYDREQEKPLRDIKTVSQSDGTYQVMMHELREGQTYSIRAVDPDGRYVSSEPVPILDVNHDGVSYDSRGSSYIRVIDFVQKNGTLTVDLP